MLSLTAFGAIAQSARVANKAKQCVPGREVQSDNRGGGGLSCPEAEGFDSGFPATWTNVEVNAAENWVYNGTGGNPDGHMDIQYDASLALQDESLITPDFDLSAIPNAALYFDWFMSYYWGVDPNDNYDLIVSISTDGGANWTQLWTEASEGEFDNYTFYTEIVPLTAYASSTAARFKFNYNGSDGAQAKFDNIKLCTMPFNDLMAVTAYAGDVINDYVYSKVPLEQAVEVVAGVVVSNMGSATQTNLDADWEVLFNGSSVASGNVAGPASLAAGATDTIWVSTGFTPTATGDVVVNMTVGSAENEEVPADNTASSGFTVTDFVWGHDVDTEDYFELGYTAAEEPSGFEMGARYFCQVDGSSIYALQFALGASTTSTAVTVKVYEGDPANGSISETLYDIQSGDLSSTAVNIITVVLDQPADMTAGNVYTATVAIEGGDGGTIMGTNADDGDGGQALYLGSDQNWYNWIGLTTSMRLNLNPDISSVGDMSSFVGFHTFPNPANDELNVSVTTRADEKVSVRLMSMAGAVVAEGSMNTLAGSASRLKLNIADVAAGMYMVQVSTATGTVTQKLAVN